MVVRVNVQRAVIDRVAVWGCLTGFLGVAQLISSTDDWPRRLWIGAGCVVVLLILADASNLAGLKWGRWRQAAGLVGAVGLASGLYAFGRSTLAAWVLVGALVVLMAWLDQFATAAFRSRIWRWGACLVLAGVGGCMPTVLNQIETRFSDEEFFVIIQAIALAGFCFLFLSGQRYLGRGQKETLWPIGRPTRLESWLVAVGVVGVTLGLGLWGVMAYQSSFYTQTAPGYPGVTETFPFVCGQAAPEPQLPSGEDVYQQILARVAANPRKRAPELGMLALGTGERRWAESFREAILAEARANQFTGPANSVKSTQHEAALRAYYAPRVRAAFPALFADEDWDILRSWFAAINRRALTVEWVDWMYALAFSKWPEGPYENQENGAGLLAILEVEKLSPPDLSPINRAYLERNRRGWAQRFHNTDDAFAYQAEWITNAYFQSLYWQATAGLAPNAVNQRLAFEWMLLQALPDGASLRYNLPGLASMAAPAYLGARLTGDPRFLWWSAQSLDRDIQGSYLNAQPGAEDLVSAKGASPTEGSCLIFSDSGLPNQKGPLAPDKIVFRDGWSPGATYLLLNLRFSGWHRYKAANTISLFYQQGAVMSEQTVGRPYGWLPVGRSQFRDKRVPRENLNGFLVEPVGLGAVLHSLVGMGSAWAQDPPHYARVESFETLGPLDVSRTVLPDWHGWTHTRNVYFIHQGPVIIVDSARGAGQAAVVWHLVGEGRRDAEGLWLNDVPSPVRMAWPPTAWQIANIQSSRIAQVGAAESSSQSVMYMSPSPGRLDLATAFLRGEWLAAQYKTQDLPGGQFVQVTGRDQTLALLQNDSGEWLPAPGLATDGRWLLTLRQGRDWLVCFDGGDRTQVGLQNRPAELFDMAGHSWAGWEWSAGTLTLHRPSQGSAVCLMMTE